MGVVLSEARIQAILDEAETILADYVSSDGQVVFRSPAHVVTGSLARADSID